MFSKEPGMKIYEEQMIYSQIDWIIFYIQAGTVANMAADWLKNKNMCLLHNQLKRVVSAGPSSSGCKDKTCDINYKDDLKKTNKKTIQNMCNRILRTKRPRGPCSWSLKTVKTISADYPRKKKGSAYLRDFPSSLPPPSLYSVPESELCKMLWEQRLHWLVFTHVCTQIKGKQLKQRDLPHVNLQLWINSKLKRGPSPGFLLFLVCSVPVVSL